MKTIKFLLKGLLFVAGVGLAAWFFMPWKQVGESLLLAAVRRLQLPVTYSSVGNVPGGFAVEDLDVRKFMGAIDCSVGTLTIVPDPTASLLNMAPTCRISFTGGVLGSSLIKKIPAVVIGSGRAAVSLGSRGVLLEGLRSDGDLSMNGALFISVSTPPPIRWAEVTIDVKSELLEQELSSVEDILKSYLPLQRESSGRWLLRRAVDRE
jgi:hypothetical protein